MAGGTDVNRIKKARAQQTRWIALHTSLPSHQFTRPPLAVTLLTALRSLRTAPRTLQRVASQWS